MTRVFFLPLLSRNFDNQLSSNFHRFVILCICWDTPSENTGLWQLPIVSSVFKRKNIEEAFSLIFSQSRLNPKKAVYNTLIFLGQHNNLLITTVQSCPTNWTLSNITPINQSLYRIVADWQWVGYVDQWDSLKSEVRGGEVNLKDAMEIRIGHQNEVVIQNIYSIYKCNANL